MICTCFLYKIFCNYQSIGITPPSLPSRGYDTSDLTLDWDHLNSKPRDVILFLWRQGLPDLYRRDTVETVNCRILVSRLSLTHLRIRITH